MNQRGDNLIDFSNIEILDELIQKIIINRADELNLKELDLWISQDKNRDIYLSRLRKFKTLHIKKSTYNEHLAWDKLKFRLSLINQKKAQPKRMVVYTLWLVAAGLLILISLIFGLKYSSNLKVFPSSNEKVVFSAPLGSIIHIYLPDSSSVWLNSGSKLSFSTQFGREKRMVTLSGEGFFDIKHNPQKPFFVYTNLVTVRVLGTAFDVKAFDDENDVTTTVQRGTVQVTSNAIKINGSKSVILHAKQMAIFQPYLIGSNANASHVEKRLKADTILPHSFIVHAIENVTSEISWKNKEWIIEHESLGSLITKIARRYNVHFQLEDSTLQSLVFSGVIHNESLEQVLNALQLSAPIQYTLIQRRVILMNTKPKNRMPMNKK